jgi:hypothetical protein
VWASEVMAQLHLGAGCSGRGKVGRYALMMEMSGGGNEWPMAGTGMVGALHCGCCLSLLEVFRVGKW